MGRAGTDRRIASAAPVKPPKLSRRADRRAVWRCSLSTASEPFATSPEPVSRDLNAAPALRRQRQVEIDSVALTASPSRHSAPRGEVAARSAGGIASQRSPGSHTALAASYPRGLRPMRQAPPALGKRFPIDKGMALELHDLHTKGINSRTPMHARAWEEEPCPKPPMSFRSE
jgi:hypothetical protein